MIKEDKSERCRDEIIIEYDAIKGFGDLTPLSCQSTVVALEDSFEIVVGINKELEDKIKELEDKIKDHEKTYIRMALKINGIKQRSK